MRYETQPLSGYCFKSRLIKQKYLKHNLTKDDDLMLLFTL